MHKKGISVYEYKLNKCWFSQITAALYLKIPGNVYVIFYSNEHLSNGRNPTRQVSGKTGNYFFLPTTQLREVP
jgi:hypothetical protein